MRRNTFEYNGLREMGLVIINRLELKKMVITQHSSDRKASHHQLPILNDLLYLRGKHGILLTVDLAITSIITSNLRVHKVCANHGYQFGYGPKSVTILHTPKVVSISMLPLISTTPETGYWSQLIRCSTPFLFPHLPLTSELDRNLIHGSDIQPIRPLWALANCSI